MTIDPIPSPGSVKANPRRGRVLVVSGPSGSGKSTILSEFLRLDEFPLQFSVSATSREPRPGEIEGKHYKFLGRQQFESMQQQGDFLESAKVHGNLYGTPKTAVEEALEKGQWVLLEIDVQGFQQVKRTMPEVDSFFVRLPTMDAYEDRLRRRGTESEQQLSKRLADVREQLELAAEYDFQIVNETVEQAVRTFRTLLWGLYFLSEGHKNDR